MKRLRTLAVIAAPAARYFQAPPRDESASRLPCVALAKAERLSRSCRARPI